MKKTNFQFYLLLLLLPGLSFGQQVLQLENCNFQEYEINDPLDIDNDGNTCEAKIELENSAYYTDNDVCDLSSINWTVTIDLMNDGTNDIEYSSSLPPDDDTLDDTNGNGVPDLYIAPTANHEIQSIQLPDIDGPMSNHKVVWLVSDACDLGDLCVTNFSVVDNSPPAVLCVVNPTLLLSGIETEIYAIDFTSSFFDHCTAEEDIQFSFSGDSIVPSRKVDCEDFINSPISLEIYFWDESGNMEHCDVELAVVTSNGGADCFSYGEISGNIKKWNDDPIAGVEVKLEADLPEFPLHTTSDQDGNYSFGELPNFVDYKISASLEDSYLTDVNTLDLVQIVRHILELEPFDDPYRIIAADINGDNQVKVNDVLSLRKLILGIIIEISSNPPWRFFNADLEFDDPLDPFPSLASTSEDLYQHEFNNIIPEGYDFIGVKTGDVSE